MANSRRSFLTSSAAVMSAFLLNRPLFSDETNQNVADKYGFAPDENMFLIGDLEPIREESTVEQLQIEGELPHELNGLFLRNGPNPQFPPLDNYHLFEGDGMIHAVHLENGKASYRNRYVRTRCWKEEHAAGKTIYPSLLDPIDWKKFSAAFLAGKQPVPNRGNTALVWHHGKLLALWEGGRPHEVSIPELETLGEYTFGEKLSHNFTAHPKVDPNTGELIFYGYQAIVPYLQHSVADPLGKIKRTTTVPLPRATMIHDAAITQNYTVFIDSPALLNIMGPLRGESVFKWAPEWGARIGVLGRHAEGSSIKWFDIQTCFVFHVFNAYEEGVEVVLHACRFKRYPTIADFSGQSQAKNSDRLLDDAFAVAFTWRINLETGKVTETALDDVSTEFPQVDQNRLGTKTRYGYCNAFTNLEQCTFHKYDFETGHRTLHELGKDRVNGEAIFVARDNAHAEDHGYLLALSYDRVRGRSELVVIAADDFASEPIARVIIPRRVPAGFHAAWVPLS